MWIGEHHPWAGRKVLGESVPLHGGPTHLETDIKMNLYSAGAPKAWSLLKVSSFLRVSLLNLTEKSGQRPKVMTKYHKLSGKASWNHLSVEKKSIQTPCSSFTHTPQLPNDFLVWMALIVSLITKTFKHSRSLSQLRCGGTHLLSATVMGIKGNSHPKEMKSAQGIPYSPCLPLTRSL